jgi:hypothetical protein
MSKALFALALLSSLSICIPQTAPDNPLEPKAIGIVYLVDHAGQTLKALPDEPWKDTFRPNHAMAATKVFACVRISGLQSPFRMKAGAKAEFVFKIGNPESVALYKMDQKKKEREADYGTIGGPGYSRQQIPGLAAEVTQFGQSAYKLVPSAPLDPGEYMVYAGNRVFTFGVDQ